MSASLTVWKLSRVALVKGPSAGSQCFTKGRKTLYQDGRRGRHVRLSHRVSIQTDGEGEAVYATISHACSSSIN